MSERVEVEAGYRAYSQRHGGFLEVSELCAAEVDGVLYHTRAWAERSAANKKAWEERSWIRRFLGLPPKGYEYHREPEPLLGSAFEWLSRR